MLCKKKLVMGAGQKFLTQRQVFFFVAKVGSGQPSLRLENFL